jgi:ApaG protein
MFSSDAMTHGVSVHVDAELDPERSKPQDNEWFFLYTVTIANLGQRTVQLVSRHWIITDAYGRTEEVRGPGVVGEQPVLGPGEEFQYTSGCPLATSFGSMHGSYRMVTESGESFEAEIAPFTLSEAFTVH